MDDNTNTMASSGGGPVTKPKTPLRKDELERIAQQLKRRLLKASITAKQAKTPDRGHPVMHTQAVASSGGSTASRPLQLPSVGGLLSSSPIDLYSPARRSPTHMRTPSALYNMRRGAANGSDSSLLGSPSRGTRPSGEGDAGQMTLQPMAPATPGKLQTNSGAQDAPTLEPSPVLNAAGSNPQTTPPLPKKQLANLLLRTPTQPQRTPRSNGNYNDTEGADLLMYLATSPLPARPTASLATKNPHSFIAPPPLTPKRHLASTSKTPQRLTPLVNLLSTFNAAGLPSSLLTLTPAGFNMNDYVNFFTPSPGTAVTGRPVPPTPNKQVDGKMINFDRVGLFNGETKD